MKKEKENLIVNQKGQTFLEFIFLLVMLISMSFAFMTGFRSIIGHRWEAIIKLIATPYSREVKIP